MNDTPACDVSVIIPTYNRLWALPAAVASCRGSRADVEIIVVDDGSRDGTWEWLQSQPDVLALRQSNYGKDWAVTAGLARARGTYVKFLDSDDAIVCGSIDRQLSIARSADADVVVSGFETVNDRGEVLERHYWEHCDDFVAQQLGEGHSSHYSAYLFRRSFIAEVPHRQEYGALDDRMFVLEVALRAPVVAELPEPALRFRHHQQARLQFAGGIGAVVTYFNTLQVYRRILTQLEARGELTRRRRVAACNVLWPLAHRIAYTHLRDAEDVVRWIYELLPDFTPPESGLLGTLYRRAGFRATEVVLRLRRHSLTPIRALRDARAAG